MRRMARKPSSACSTCCFPEWRISPFLTLGTGYRGDQSARYDRAAARSRRTRPPTPERASRFYLTRRFFLRADYRWHTVFTSRDDNEELEEWKVVIACFF